MHFTCPKADLLAAVSIGTRAIPSSSVDTNLLNVLLSLNKSGQLTLLSTDNRIAVTHTMKVSDSKPGKVAILGGLLLEILQGLQTSRSDEVSFTVDENNRSTIKSADADYELPGFSGEMYPLVPEIKDGKEFTIAAGLLKDLIRKTIIVAPSAASGGANSYDFVSAECNGGEITFVSTDSVRLAIRTVTAEKVPDFSCLIPAPALAELQRTMKTDGNVTITLSQDFIAFDFGASQLRSRLVDARFPSWREILPKTQSRWATLRTNEVRENLKGVLPIAKDQKSKVTVEFLEDKVIIETNSPDYGRARREVEATLEGQPIKLSFSGRYLLDFLSVVDSESFRWGVSSQQYPALMKPDADDPGYVYVVMPITNG